MGFTSLKAFLDTAGNHQRNVSTKDANGGDVAAWTTLAANKKFAIYPIDSEIRSDYARQDIIVTDAVVIDEDLDAKPRDRIAVGATYYIVRGLEPYKSNAIFPYPVYVMHCERRVN